MAKIKKSGPVLLRAFAAGNEDAAGAQLSERARILSHLDTKIRRLRRCETALEALLDVTTDPVTFARIEARAGDARGERALCRARFVAIDNNQPFSDPGPGAEAALLAAIAEVDAAVANTAAVEALLGAVHGLVEAYRAQETEAGA